MPPVPSTPTILYRSDPTTKKGLPSSGGRFRRAPHARETPASPDRFRRHALPCASILPNFRLSIKPWAVETAARPSGGFRFSIPCSAIPPSAVLRSANPPVPSPGRRFPSQHLFRHAVHVHHHAFRPVAVQDLEHSGTPPVAGRVQVDFPRVFAGTDNERRHVVSRRFPGA